jgi:hypothetical protein
MLLLLPATPFALAGLDPAIHVLQQEVRTEDVGARIKSGHGE